VGSNTVRLYFRRELALAQSLFDRFLAAINPLPLGLVVASAGGLSVFARHSARLDALKGPTLRQVTGLQGFERKKLAEALSDFQKK
jgi:hypothetical protein